MRTPPLVTGKKYFIENNLDPKKRGWVYLQGQGFLGSGHVTLLIEEEEKARLGLEGMPHKFIGTWAGSWLWSEERL